MDQPKAVYIHVPFCAHRCGYCDFTLVAGKDHLAESYLQALEIEMDRVLANDPPESLEPLETVFLGGGTPTQLSADQLMRLMELIRSRFLLTDRVEFSVEANPAGFTAGKLDVLGDAGVNRISLGVQSFDAETLTMLERDHRQKDILACMERTRSRIPNISLDLIFAVPGQSLNLWEETLSTAIDLQPAHLSTYGLTFEKGTAFWSRRERGELAQADDELEREMYAVAMQRLAEAGFEQYEISSFARPGFRCRHNQLYWTGEPFFGFGPGAASFRSGRRLLNHRSVTTWLNKTIAGEDAIGEVEELEAEDRSRELLVLGLRRIEGVRKAFFERRTGLSLTSFAGTELDRLIDRGLLEETPEAIRLTYEGRFFYDTVAGELL